MRPPVTPRATRKVLRGLGAASAEGEIVFTRAALVGVALDGDRVARIERQPLSLTAEDCLGLGIERGRVGVEEHAVADVDHEVLGAARRRGASTARSSGELAVEFARALAQAAARRARREQALHGG